MSCSIQRPPADSVQAPAIGHYPWTVATSGRRLLSHGTRDRPRLIGLPSESRSGWRVADPPQRPALFVNPNSGGGKAARAGLAERARDRGIDVIVMRPDETLEVLVDEAMSRGADALGVAGGDGSLAVVAAAAVVHGLPFVCVPAGTRNHFALDLGVDRRDLVGSLEAFTDGLERRIDVAEVTAACSSTMCPSGSTAMRFGGRRTVTPRPARFWRRRRK